MNGAAERLFLAIIGGIVSSEALLLRPDGAVLARVRGGGSSPKRLGFDAAVGVLDGLRARAMSAAGLPSDTQPQRVGAFLAGIDLPVERERILEALAPRFPGAAVVVENDVHAVLWAGLRRPAGAAVICGEGINAIARSATGKTAGYLALGQISGEWGGGLQLGREVLYAASRAEDGRGPQTSLRYRVAAHFRRPSVREALMDLELGNSVDASLAGLVPILFEADVAGDAVAQAMVDRLADEVVHMVRAAMDRARVPPSGSDVVLAGSVLTAGHERLDRLVDERFAEVLPGAAVARLTLPLVVGAALGCVGADRGGPVSDDNDVHRIMASLDAAAVVEIGDVAVV